MLWAAPAVPASANPCVLEYVGGRNVLAGAPQKDIFIVGERLRIDLTGARRRIRYSAERIDREPVFEGEVRISYRFDNRGPARQVVIGFPIGLYNDESLYPWKNIVSRFAARGAGAGPLLDHPESSGLTIDRAPLSGCEAENSMTLGEWVVSERVPPGPAPPPVPRYVWYAWQQTFQPGTNQVEVSYHVRMVAPGPGADAGFTFGYVLSTTATWGDGTIGRFDVAFSGDGLPGRWRVIRGLGRPYAENGPNRKRWSRRGFVPTDDLLLGFDWAGSGT